jgi:hypothetical protein
MGNHRDNPVLEGIYPQKLQERDSYINLNVE